MLSADDTTFCSKCDLTFDLRQQLQMVSELDFDVEKLDIWSRN